MKDTAFDHALQTELVHVRRQSEANPTIIAQQAPRAPSLWVAAGLAVAPAVALGLGRFAYALLLPSMRADLAWTYADAGAMNTANAAGYLAGALAAALTADRFGVKRAFLVSLFFTCVTIGATGLTSNFQVLLALRFATGAAGAVAFVAGASLAAASGGNANRTPLALGIYVAGGGAGIVVSALTVPFLAASVGWKAGWLALAVLGFASFLIAATAVIRSPDPGAVPSGGAREPPLLVRVMPFELGAYALFGAGYIAYATFIIAFLKSELSFTAPEVSMFWVLLGLASIAGAFAWTPVLSRLKGGLGATATIAMVTAGALLPLIWAGRPAAYISAVLFGGSCFAVIAAVTTFARRAAPHRLTKAIAALTTAFGIGQCAGPVLSGAASSGVAGIQAGLWLSAGILAAAATLASFQTEPNSKSRAGVSRAAGAEC